MEHEIRELTLDDLSAITALHCASFSDSTLTSLGEKAVARYYHWLLTGPHDAAYFGVSSNNRLLGFCICGKFRGALSGFVRKNWLFLAAQSLVRPRRFLSGVFRRRIGTGVKALIRRPTQATKGRDATDYDASFGILAIAVSPDNWKSGVGKLLLQQAENLASERGFAKMILSVSQGNERAIAFYEKLGWKRVMEDGEWKGRMTKLLVF